MNPQATEYKLLWWQSDIIRISELEKWNKYYIQGFQNKVFTFCGVVKNEVGMSA